MMNKKENCEIDGGGAICQIYPVDDVEQEEEEQVVYLVNDVLM